MRLIRVLLVDDNLRFLNTLQRFLTHPALQIVGTASTGCEALDKAAYLQPDLVLMDIAMPDMNGLEAARHIKAQRHAPRVIILTLYDQLEYIAEASRAGADGLIVKSEMAAQLWPTIRVLFETRPLHTAKPA